MLEREITVTLSKVPRQDCQKVPETVCKPEARVKVVEVEEEVCDEEKATTPKTTTTTTTKAPVTKKIGESYPIYTDPFIIQAANNQLSSLSDNSYLPPPPDTSSVVDLRSNRRGRKRNQDKKPRRGQRQGQGKKNGKKRKGRRAHNSFQKKVWTICLHHMTSREMFELKREMEQPDVYNEIPPDCSIVFLSEFSCNQSLKWWNLFEQIHCQQMHYY